MVVEALPWNWYDRSTRWKIILRELQSIFVSNDNLRARLNNVLLIISKELYLSELWKNLNRILKRLLGFLISKELRLALFPKLRTAFILFVVLEIYSRKARTLRQKCKAFVLLVLVLFMLEFLLYS